MYPVITRVSIIALCLVGLAVSGCMPAVVPVAKTDAQPVQRLVASTPAQPPGRRQVLEALFTAAVVSQEVYARHDTLSVRWPDDLPISGELNIRIQKPDGRIYLERHFLATAAAEAGLGKAYQLPPGEYDVVLMPTPSEYYIGGLRVTRRIRVWVSSDPQ
ncbi:MAG: hypothetical protein DCC55_03020 [Chloroflexi bacterium]|nr:MAG: hypothetical protein DCC55_03020 [Chloroflexota bacterium]